jgi:hypothetical protein
MNIWTQTFLCRIIFHKTSDGVNQYGRLEMKELGVSLMSKYAPPPLAFHGRGEWPRRVVTLSFFKQGLLVAILSRTNVWFELGHLI